MRGRLLVIVLAAVAVAVVYATRGDHRPKPQEQAVTAGPGAIHVRFAYSTEKTALMTALVERFNARRVQLGGRQVFVDGSAIASGEAEQAIAHGTLKPDAWSPASSLWSGLLNYDADQTWAPPDSPSLMRTPLVIAMWEPMARALGWPAKRIGFADLLRLARSGAGWAAFGHPELGPFRLVHTNPDFSTSGLSAVAAEYFAAAGRSKGLSPHDITRSRAHDVVRRLERSIVHYGDTTPFVAERMHAEGTGYASAVAMEEATLLDFNRHRRSGQPRLVALYPAEGTFYSDNPFIVLDTPWARPEQARAALAFRRFLAEALTPAFAGRYFFRPTAGARPAAEISTAGGANPEQPARVLDPPAPSVLAAIRRAWRLDRKPANVLLVLDTSASMADAGRLAHAKAGLRAFLAGVQPQDSVGLETFSTDLHLLVPVGPARKQLPLLRRTVDGLTPDAGTAMYDATADAVRRVDALPRRAGHINAVVVLTDGDDTSSRNVDVQQLIASLDAKVDDPDRVRVYTIAYAAGKSRFAGVLTRIAAAGGGRAYLGTTGNIESIYTSVSSFF
jgi:Ca-activated chloride channel family protein